MDEQTSVALIQALAAIWSAIRARHPDVPGVVLLPAPAQRGKMNVLGHFAALRWVPRKEKGGLLHEVVVVAEHLNRSAEDITETLLHEAAHAMNFARNIHDCSASQYHNKKFMEAAQELGLEVVQVPHYGFALTSLPKTTAELYAAETRALEEVLVHRHHAIRLPTKPPGTTPGGGTTKGGEDEGGNDDVGREGRSRKAVCACDPPFIIRVSKKTIEATVVRCESCGEPFRLVLHLPT